MGERFKRLIYITDSSALFSVGVCLNKHPTHVETCVKLNYIHNLTQLFIARRIKNILNHKENYRAIRSIRIVHREPMEAENYLV